MALRDAGVRSSGRGHAVTLGRRCPILARRQPRANHGGLDQEGGVRAARRPVVSVGAGEFGSVRRDGGEPARRPMIGPWSHAKRRGSTPNPAQDMVTNSLFEKRPNRLGIGCALPPKKDLHLFANAASSSSASVPSRGCFCPFMLLL
ncbi:hypothetical protein VPH35_003248 [Triticum aestivum]